MFMFSEQELKTSNTNPTVVMVTRAHQKPSQDPRRNGGGNSPGLLAWSYRQNMVRLVDKYTN